MKKVLSIFMALLMILTVVSTVAFSAFADEAVADSVFKNDMNAQDAYSDAVSKAKTNGETEFNVYTADQLFALAGLINASTDGFVGCTINLKCDIVFNEGNAADWVTTAPTYPWSPIGSTTAPFQGTFNGEGHTVSGLYIKSSSTSDNIGMFGRIKGATIKNLGVVNSLVYVPESHQGAYAGGLVGSMYNVAGTIEGCYSEAIIEADTYGVGGIVALVNFAGCAIKQCAFAGKINVTTKGTAAGIAGVVQKNDVVIEDCVNLGEVKAESRAAGIVAYATNNPTLTLARCLNLGKVETNAYAELSRSGDDRVYSTEKRYDGAAFFGSVTSGSTITVNDCYLVTGLEQTQVYTGRQQSYNYVNANNENKTQAADAGSTTDATWATTASVAASAIKGDAAKTALTKLDFANNVWSAREGDYPVPTAVKTIIDGVANVADPNATTGGNDDTGANTDTNNDTNNDANNTNNDTNKADETTDPQTITTADATETDAVEESGCGSAIGGAAIALVIAVGGACAFVGKKRK